ncbi:MAG TPA: response regulator [Planctomycetota bacterium]|nr:response regulator [Planctomycetota bacterium]
MATTERPAPRILIIDDNNADIELVREAFSENDIAATFTVANSGQQALDLLRSADTPAPDMILLDLQMPAMDGQQVLNALKADAATRSIPVVMMTSSERPEDISEAYGNAVSTYIVKPVQWGRLLNTVKSLEQFWFNAARLPRAAGKG